MHFGPFDLKYDRLRIESLSLEVNNSVTHLWGANGVGKSTLLNLILKQTTEKGISFGYLSQNYRSNWLWWQDIWSNLELASGIKRKELEDNPLIIKHWSWLEPLISQSTAKVNFSTQTTESTVSLSGGQLQKVILLRELLRRPKILFLDESFSAIDKDSCFELINWLKEEQKVEDFQIISIMHNWELVELFGGEVVNISLRDGLMSLDSKLIN